LFPVLNFLKWLLTEWFSIKAIIAFKTLDISQGSVLTHLRCGGIFSDNSITFFPDSESEIIFTALHGMQTRSSDEYSVRLPVRPPVKWGACDYRFKIGDFAPTRAG